jgi:hypothetical protein
LQVSFGKQKKQSLKHYSNASARTLYYTLINADEFPDVTVKAYQLVTDYLDQSQEMLANEKSLPANLPVRQTSYAPALGKKLPMPTTMPFSIVITFSIKLSAFYNKTQSATIRQ